MGFLRGFAGRIVSGYRCVASLCSHLPSPSRLRLPSGKRRLGWDGERWLLWHASRRWTAPAPPAQLHGRVLARVAAEGTGRVGPQQRDLPPDPTEPGQGLAMVPRATLTVFAFALGLAVPFLQNKSKSLL